MSEVPGSGGQGKLAQVIAARGGLAPPEAPFVIEHREALIYMLCQASELEHGIMCQYLFAAFSLKQREDEGLTAGELAAATRWRKVIAHVATEEMLHLALVHNLLSAIGAAPHFARPNLPAPAHHYPAGVHLALVPFGEEALQHFMFLERPEGMALTDAAGLGAAPADSARLEAALAEAVPLMAEGDIVPHLQDFATVGHLYRSIELGIAHLAEKFGERWLFVGPPRAQATQAAFGWPELVAVTDLESAQKAIDTILEQGEGARGHWEHAHFGQFVQILDEYRQMKSDNPAFDPVRPVIHAKVRPGDRDDGFPLIGDPATARCVDLFNVAYEILLQTLERFFAHTEETDSQLATLADATVAIMLRVLRPLGDLTSTLPAGDEYPGRTAGPSFELFYETDYLMPHREAAWTLLEERLRDASVYCRSLEAEAEPSLAERLHPVAQALDEIADSLAAHFADWGAPPRHVPDAEGPSTSPSPDAQPDGEPFLERAAELDASLPAQAPGAASTLFRATYSLLEATAGESAVQESLLKSVLRPLASAVKGGGDAGSPAPAVEVAIGAGDRLGESLWQLAQAATASCAATDRDASVFPALAEAAACLQRLALERSAQGDEAATRITRLRELQAALPQEICVGQDGPYLVTGALAVRDWLGVELPVTPLVALCRCGESKRKPFCDGTHAEIGFSGEKDPGRVPDRRDSYPGVQLTILDNRGICQHSGFCTDRIATAFRASEEPFVAPSGARMDELIRAVRECPSGALSYAVDGVEARADADHHGVREPAIEVTKDGPYRITGGLELRGAGGAEVARNAGSSREHYALCRCGHSQNKPFCSGMHWYVDFRDPQPDPDRVPTLFEWCGGLPALRRMTQRFYEKLIPEDPLLAPRFASMSPEHPERVARWLGEVFGGPPSYSGAYGGYSRMLSQHLAKALSEEERSRWVTLLSRAAQEAGLPSDPEFRSAFSSYIEWGSRLAVANSQPGAAPPPKMPMPHWDWGTAGPPGVRVSALAPPEPETAVELPGEGEPVRFEAHVKQLFRERDRKSMRFAFDLWSYADVVSNAAGILERLRNGTMPCDGAWPPERVEVFQRWVDAGTPE